LQRVDEHVFPENCEAATTLLAGDGWTQYPSIRPAEGLLVAEAGPVAGRVLAIALDAGPAAWIDARQAEPSYVRGVSAWKTREAQAAARG
jgi:hypothetical protein